MPPSTTDLLRFLRRSGTATATQVAAHLGVSQPTVSRLVNGARDEVLVVGRGRATRYAARRDVADLGRRFPLYEIQEAGTSRLLATLHATGEAGFYVEAHTPDIESAAYDDLPYFLDGLRPGGFLGRLVPLHHPEIGGPSDVTLWTSTNVLAYLTQYGWSLTGNLIVGARAFGLHMQYAAAPPDLVRAEERAAVYPRLADNILGGVRGSSARGEQPKFLATRADGDITTAVLVKFSPPVVDAGTQRLADLLLAEHMALRTLHEHNHAAASSQVIHGKDRVFLEVERFDRTPGAGRRGLISLQALDAHFAGRLQTWSDSARALAVPLALDEATLSEIRWRELFGLLIANTDMHGANLSFFTRGTRLDGLAPIYDMLPMAYSPQYGHLRPPGWTASIPSPGPSDGPLWDSACAAAIAFWEAVSLEPRVSTDFRALADGHATEVRRVRPLGRLLPGGPG